MGPLPPELIEALSKTDGSLFSLACLAIIALVAAKGGMFVKEKTNGGTQADKLADLGHKLDTVISRLESMVEALGHSRDAQTLGLARNQDTLGRIADAVEKQGRVQEQLTQTLNESLRQQARNHDMRRSGE